MTQYIDSHIFLKFELDLTQSLLNCLVKQEFFSACE